MNGIPFSPEMLRAWRAGRKTQTRRVVKPSQQARTPDIYSDIESPAGGWFRPRYKPGSVVYIKEALCRLPGEEHDRVAYSLDGAIAGTVARAWTWKPSKLAAMYMPEWAARDYARVESVRVERITDISDEDIKAEGITPNRMAWWNGRIRLPDGSPSTVDVLTSPDNPGEPPDYLEHPELLRYEYPLGHAYRDLWRRINGYDSWRSDVYVWVYDLSRLDGPR